MGVSYYMAEPSFILTLAMITYRLNDYLYAMPKDISIVEYLNEYSHLPLVDVRSPGEFDKGHIPHAINIPLFTNDERAHVGTVYKQQSQEAAVDLGYKYVTPKLQWFIDESVSAAPDKNIVIHCWRGGMRSHAFAQHLKDNGFNKVYVISKGYKAYRHEAQNNFDKGQLLLLGGYTGSGKTHILHKIEELGHQVLDLEGLASHKGSAFGNIGMGQQPTTEQFENNLYWQWRQFDFSRPIWVEDESPNIGDVNIPMHLFHKMRLSPLYFVEIRKEERAKLLVDEYAIGDKTQLENSVRRISKRLGNDTTKKALELLDDNNFYEVALLTLGYYDKYYKKGIEKRMTNNIRFIPMNNTNADKNAETLIAMNNLSEVKLTQYSHGAGCGCKIAPSVLTDILKSNISPIHDEKLLVGNSSRDDAAVYDMGDGTAIISTTDFFMPIVDDPFTFGKIAAANAISDIYAMGGEPLLAIAILGWPINKLSPEVASQVMDGGRQACKEAGIVLAGGHSIDSPEPIFGLAVTGRVDIARLKRNDTATKGCKLYLTKPLGVGILSTAQKKGILKDEHAHIAPSLMSQLNKLGAKLAAIDGVKAMTDVTGFSLIGHLSEMCEGSQLSAKLSYNLVPKLPMLQDYIEQKCMPGGTSRNWLSYGHQVELNDEAYKHTLCDPQTSGGLLLAVEEAAANKVELLLKQNDIAPVCFGELIDQQDKLIYVE